MNKLDSTIGVKKIELLFAENLDFPSIDIKSRTKILNRKNKNKTFILDSSIIIHSNI